MQQYLIVRCPYCQGLRRLNVASRGLGEIGALGTIECMDCGSVFEVTRNTSESVRWTGAGQPNAPKQRDGEAYPAPRGSTGGPSC